MEDSLTLVELYLIPWTIKILAAVAILVIGMWLSARVTRMLARVMERSRLDVMLVKFLTKLVYALLLVVVVLAAVDNLGINITSFLAVLGAAGLAVGLALKDSLSNFAAGVMIIIFRPFRIGDFITAAGSSGVVDEIGMFCTLLHTPDNQRLIVPNASIINGTITNTNALGTRRIDLVIGISYEDNIGEAKAIITALVQADERVLQEPAFSLGVLELADSSVNLFVRPWTNVADYWATRTDLHEKIKDAFDAAGITIPYPQQNVFMNTVEKPRN